MLFLGMKVNQAKSQFLDRAAVADATTRAERRSLARGGGFVRKTARRMIRRRKRPAKPGQAPSNRTGLIKRLILFVFEPVRRTVVIGPAKLNRSSFAGEPDDALAILEHGGRTQRRLTGFDRETGAVLAPAASGRWRSKLTGKFVPTKRVQIRRTRQAPLVATDYDPHPFMAPALNKAVDKGALADVWRDSIRA